MVSGLYERGLGQGTYYSKAPLTPRGAAGTREGRSKFFLGLAAFITLLGGAYTYRGLPTWGSLVSADPRTAAALTEGEMTASSLPAPSLRHGGRAFVMCAPPTDQALRMAWTQITVIREFLGHQEYPDDAYLVYHADELTEEDEEREEVKALRKIPGAELRNLRDWYNATYGGEEADVDAGMDRFRGFYCKPAALAAADYEEVALVDLDVMLTTSPFDLSETDMYQKTGAFLFRDLVSYWRHAEECTMSHVALDTYRDTLRTLWTTLRREEGVSEDDAVMTDLPPALAESPIFTGLSYDVGESAVVLYDRRRNHRGVTVLERLLSPELFDHLNDLVYGDKEHFWLSLALAMPTDSAPASSASKATIGGTGGLPMNPYAWVALGRQRYDNQTGVNLTCSYEHALGQWSPPLSAYNDTRPRLFYLNGDGVELMIRDEQGEGNSTWSLDTSYVGAPLLYEEARCHLDYCSADAVPLPPEAREAFLMYQVMWKRAEIAMSPSALNRHQ